MPIDSRSSALGSGKATLPLLARAGHESNAVRTAPVKIVGSEQVRGTTGPLRQLLTIVNATVVPLRFAPRIPGITLVNGEAVGGAIVRGSDS